MPGMSGKDLCDGLQSLRPGLKCLFMSGYDKDIFGSARRAGVGPGLFAETIQTPGTGRHGAGIA